MKAKFSQNHFLEPSWGLLGAFWAHLEKNLKKLTPLEANLGSWESKSIKKIEKNQCQKKTCAKRRFVFKISRIFDGFACPKTWNFEPIFVVTPKMSNL